MSIKVIIYNPSKRNGGTNNLLTNLTIVLSKSQLIKEIAIVDYIDGKSIEYLKANNIKVKHEIYNPKVKILVDDCILIATLLDLKLINKNFSTTKNTRFLFWCTHRDDGIKLIPTFNIYLNIISESYESILSHIIDRKYKKRIGLFINEGMKNKGIVWMDNQNYERNKKFYNLREEPTILPLITSNPKLRKTFYENKRELNICFLGRLCDFKVPPILGLLEQINDSVLPCTITFIGDGLYKNDLIKKLEKLGIDKYNFIGNIDFDKLDSCLMNVDAVIGMGTSVLESAKLGLPSLVINGSLKPVRGDQIKLLWLHTCKPPFVGRRLKKNETMSNGITFGEMLAVLQEPSRRKKIGQKSYEYWRINHSPDRLEKAIMNILKLNTFYRSDANIKLLNMSGNSKLITYIKKLYKNYT